MFGNGRHVKLKTFLIKFWRNEDGFFGVDMGVSQDQQSQHNNLTAASGFATGLGEQDLTASSNFMNEILSGDPTKVATALAPQINQQQQRTQQAKDTTAQFGPRSGGTAATVANMGAADRASTTDLVGGLTGKAASDLGSMGSGLLSTGMSGDITGFDQASALQKQKAAKFNDIMSSTAAVAAAPFTGGASLSGLAGGGAGSGMGGGFSMPNFGGGAVPQASQDMFTEMMAG